jgi:alkylation response protein AidB-like acyl-CoA dehydrogenase
MTGSAAPLGIDGATSATDAVAAVEQWVRAEVPETWRNAAAEGPKALRAVRSQADYHSWYPVFAASGLVAPTWQPEYGGLGLTNDVARAIETVLAPLRLTRLNPLGLNNAASALFSHGTDEQRLRFLPPIVRNEEKWCQLFSEPGAGSDLASLATKAVRDGSGDDADWVITGQKVWTTWADEADFGILLARTDPDQPKHRGITYFLLDMHQPGVVVRPLRQITGEAEFNEVFLDGARVPDAHRVGELNDGWRVSASTLSSERQMVSGSGSGGMGRLGGSSTDRLIALAQETGRWVDPVVRQKVMRLWVQERIRGFTNARVRAALSAGQSPGAASSIGKVHQATLNQQVQDLMVDLLGSDAIAWPPRDDPNALPREIQGWMRSLANSTEGGTTDINKNILGERVLGLPREPDPWKGRPWKDIPRS